MDKKIKEFKKKIKAKETVIRKTANPGHKAILLRELAVLKAAMAKYVQNRPD